VQSIDRSVYNAFVKERIMENKAPISPFTEENATKKVRMAEDAWNI
jgi:hypothetical protein